MVAYKMLQGISIIAPAKLTLASHELQEIVILLSQNPMERFWTAIAGHEVVRNKMFGIKLITQIAFILTSKT